MIKYIFLSMVKDLKLELQFQAEPKLSERLRFQSLHHHIILMVEKSCQISFAGVVHNQPFGYCLKSVNAIRFLSLHNSRRLVQTVQVKTWKQRGVTHLLKEVLPLNLISVTILTTSQFA